MARASSFINKRVRDIQATNELRLCFFCFVFWKLRAELILICNLQQANDVEFWEFISNNIPQQAET